MTERFGAPGDVACHACEDNPVERHDRLPVRVPRQPARQEHGPLAVDALPVSGGFGAHLQPGPAGYLHLGAQPQ